jgi:hypothetical protein
MSVHVGANRSAFDVLLVVAAILFMAAFVIAVGWVGGNSDAFLCLGLAVFALAGLFRLARPV